MSRRWDEEIACDDWAAAAIAFARQAEDQPPTYRQLVERWCQRADDLQARANRLGPTPEGKVAFTEASTLRHCLGELLTVEEWGQ